MEKSKEIDFFLAGGGEGRVVGGLSESFKTTTGLMEVAGVVFPR